MTDTGEPSAAGSIGIFDSGVGGLSVAREIRGTLPAEDLLYVADTAYCPYGDRPLEEVRARALAVGRYLQDAGAKLVVAACNTATGAALEDLRAALSIPVVGLEPAVKTAVAQTRARRVGVLATSGTASVNFAPAVVEAREGRTPLVVLTADRSPELRDRGAPQAIDQERLYGRQVKWYAEVPTPEAGSPSGDVLERHLRLVDSAPAIARRTAQLLEQGRERRDAGDGGLRVLTTGDPGKVAAVVQRLWGRPVVLESVRI